MSAHARLSPSGSKKWVACPGSLVLEQAYPNKSSEYSDDGTAMHSVASDCLQSVAGLIADDFLGDSIEVQGEGEPLRTVMFTEAMVELTQGYIDDVRARKKTAVETMIETRVEFSEFVGVDDQFGTADASFLHAIEGEPGCYELEVEDLKTGYHFVSVERNSQLMLYALGLYLIWSLSYDITRVRLTIYQPRHGGPREWTCSIAELLAFADEMKVAAARAEEATRLHPIHVVKGSSHEREGWERTFLNPNPNEDECAFCRAMPTCPAVRRKLEADVGLDFEVIDEKESRTPVQVLKEEIEESTLLEQDFSAKLGKLMSITGLLEDWIKAVRAEVERRLLLEIPVDGFGLELGRQGARGWISKDKAEEMLRKQFRVKMEDTYDMSLKSPTQIEKLAVPPKRKKGDDTPVVKPVLTPKQWEKLQPLIGRSDPKPSVKPVGQIKTPYVIAKPNADDFDTVDEGPATMVEDNTPLF